jgi:hypothetical protein
LEGDLDVVVSRLDQLDMSKLPLCIDDDDSLAHVASVWLALVDLCAIFKAFKNQQGLHGRSDSTTFFDRCLPLLVARWTSVTAWWTHELLYIQNDLPIADACVVFISSVISGGKEDDQCREELAVSKRTLDLICTLICRTEWQENNDKARRFPDSRGINTTQDSAILVKFLAFQYFASGTQGRALQGRLCSKNHRRRRAAPSISVN